MLESEYNIYKEVIDRYMLLHADDYLAWKKELDLAKKELADPKYATLKDEKAMRWAGSIPKQLDTQLKLISLRMLNKDDYLTPDFLKRFPMFRVAEKL